MPAKRRQAIVKICREHDVAIIENGALAPLVTNAPAPLTALAPERSYYIGSLSKATIPALRVGFIRAPIEAQSTLESAAGATVWSGSPLLAEIATQWINDGTAEAIRDSRLREAAARQAIAASALRGHPYLAHRTAYFLWMKIPDHRRAMEIFEQAHARDVLLGPAHLFAARPGNAPNALRVSSPRRDPTASSSAASRCWPSCSTSPPLLRDRHSDQARDRPARLAHNNQERHLMTPHAPSRPSAPPSAGPWPLRRLLILPAFAAILVAAVLVTRKLRQVPASAALQSDSAASATRPLRSVLSPPRPHSGLSRWIKVAPRQGSVRVLVRGGPADRNMGPGRCPAADDGTAPVHRGAASAARAARRPTDQAAVVPRVHHHA